MQIVETIDTWIARVLWVPPQPVPQTAERTSAPGERGLGISLVFSAVRCTLQYIILPFLLPLIGLTSNLSLGIVMVLDVVALILVTTSLRQLWKARHPRRWTFLPLALVAIVLIIAFLGYDIQMLRA
jgi:ABC-type iron transport system FetAB permease component